METQYARWYSPSLNRVMECKVYGHAGKPAMFIPCQNKGGDPYWRIRRHEEWIRYLTQEVVPFMQDRARDRNGWDGDPGLLVYGSSLGATHAVNLYFRFPTLFDRLLALSGIYTAAYGFDDYMDEMVYLNSPEHYLPNMSPDHPYIDLYNRNKGVICVGLGAWEMPESTRNIDHILRSKGIRLWVDYWGQDCAHDWPWWYKQCDYFLPFILD